MKISVIVNSLDWMPRKFRDGIFRYAKGRDWEIRTVEFDDRTATCFNLASLSDDHSAEDGFRISDSDGCIFICGGVDYLLKGIRGRRIPIVFLDRSRLRANEACVLGDSSEIARTAAKELLALGFGDYAYAPWPDRVIWSDVRGAAFEKAICAAGRRFHRLGRGNLSDELDRLPKPCGIFAANDFVANKVVSLCHAQEIAIPSRIAVLGVDNDPQICENARTSISSVEQDIELGGYRAAEVLDGLMQGRDCARTDVTYGVRQVERRASTRLVRNSDRRVLAGLEFIRRHATERITPADVATALGCSRNLADLLFKASVGHTVHAEIVRMRVERVKAHLLQPNRDLSAIHDFCGFASAADMRRVFKASTGLTPSQWRISPRL